jgi:predicted transcriptional regulator of viral defense system
MEIATLADRQHGVVALRQLRKLGLSARAVQYRAARGQLHRIHRGVYAVGRSKLTGRGQVALEKEWVTRTLLALASRADGDGSRRAGAQAA